MHPDMDLSELQAKRVFEIASMAIDAMVIDKVMRFKGKNLPAPEVQNP